MKEVHLKWKNMTAKDKEPYVLDANKDKKYLETTGNYRKNRKRKFEEIRHKKDIDPQVL